MWRTQRISAPFAEGTSCYAINDSEGEQRNESTGLQNDPTPTGGQTPAL